MKARILLSIIAVAAFAVTTINVSASETLLTPRAAGNQIKTVSEITAAQPAFTTQSVSPRALDNRSQTVAGVANDVNSVLACRSMMIGSPKAVQACAEHPGTMPGCNPVTAASLK